MVFFADPLKNDHVVNKHFRVDVMEFQHNGYHKNSKGKQAFKRKITIDLEKSTFIINDNLSGKGNHNIGLSFLIPQKYWECEQEKINSGFSIQPKNLQFSLTGNRLILRKIGIVSYSCIERKHTSLFFGFLILKVQIYQWKYATKLEDGKILLLEFLYKND
jgi:hypothetical protein